MPICAQAGITQSPVCRPESLPPDDSTSKTPSFPGTADGSGVPKIDVNGGLDPYVPWTVLISAGLIGAARDLRSTEFVGSVGEIECVWSLFLLAFQAQYSS